MSGRKLLDPTTYLVADRTAVTQQSRRDTAWQSSFFLSVLAVNMTSNNSGWRRDSTTGLTLLRHISPHYTHPVRTAQRTQSVTTSKTSRWTLYAETVTADCENRTEHISTPCRQNADFLVLNLAVQTAATGLWNSRLTFSKVSRF